MVTILMVTAVPSAGATGETYLDERFEDGVDIFRSGHWGMLPLDNGHQGAGLKSVMPTGKHWGSSGWWHFEDNGFSQPEELYWRYWIRFDDDFYLSLIHI